MTKVIGMLVALAMFCAMPAVAFAGGEEVDGNQEAEIDSGAVVGGGDDGDPYGNGDDNGNGDIDVSDEDRNAICQQIAADDARCDIDQSQNFGGDTFVDVNRNGVNDRHERVGVRGGGGVVLARTGFDAWLPAAFGGLLLVGGIALLTAQRRGRMSR